MDKRAERDETISGFLTTAGWGSEACTALAGDASFRRYWRLTDGARRAVLMDAPPDKLDIRPFPAIDAHLRGLGFPPPRFSPPIRRRGPGRHAAEPHRMPEPSTEVG
jgi:aminoglycoside/choline kinase family phosphotransferase